MHTVHVPFLCVLCNPCMLFKVVLWSNFGHCTTYYNQCTGENRKKKTLTYSTILNSSWERECVNLIFSPNTGLDVSYKYCYKTCPISLCAL